MGSDESLFNVSFIARGTFTRQCLETTTLEEKLGQPKPVEFKSCVKVEVAVRNILHSLCGCKATLNLLKPKPAGNRADVVHLTSLTPYR